MTGCLGGWPVAGRARPETEARLLTEAVGKKHSVPGQPIACGVERPLPSNCGVCLCYLGWRPVERRWPLFPRRKMFVSSPELGLQSRQVVFKRAFAWVPPPPSAPYVSPFVSIVWVLGASRPA